MANAVVLACSGVLFDEGGRVLFHRSPQSGLWLLPGGAVEPDETPWAAVVRETSEEVGLIVSVERLSSVVWRPHRDEMLFTFVVRRVGGELRLSNEADDIRWFDEPAMRQDVLPRYRERVGDARRAGPAMRVEQAD